MESWKAWTPYVYVQLQRHCFATVATEQTGANDSVCSRSFLDESEYTVHTAFMFISFPFYVIFWLRVRIPVPPTASTVVNFCRRGTGEASSKKPVTRTVVSAEKDFTDGTVAFQSKSKCIPVAVELQ